MGEKEFNQTVYDFMRGELESISPVGSVNIDVSVDDFIKFVDWCDCITNWDCILYDNLRVMEFTEINQGFFKNKNQAYLLDDALYDLKTDIIEDYGGSLKSYMDDHYIGGYNMEF